MLFTTSKIEKLNDKSLKGGNAAYRFNVLSEGTTLRGRIDSGDDILINCRLQGDVSCSSRTVIGQNASVEGNVASSVLEVMGRVRGDISAQGLLVLHPMADVEGNIVAGNLEIHRGARFAGNCKAHEDRNKENINE